MKKIIEWIKDILYDSIDYIIMIAIIGAVALIIGWRLDLLFAKEAANVPVNEDLVAENPKDDNRDNIDNSNSDSEDNDNDIIDIPDLDDNIDESSNENSQITDDNDDNIDDNSTGVITVKVVIPPGSLPSKIASILEEHNLISSRAEFIQKTQELKLDTKLKSGTFEIKSNSSLEEIIRAIAK